MRYSLKSRGDSRWIMSEPDSTECAALVCRTCGSDLVLHQPDPQMPERILGACGECKSWFLLDSGLGYVQIAPGAVDPGKKCLPETTPVLSHALRSLNGHA